MFIMSINSTTTMGKVVKVCFLLFILIKEKHIVNCDGSCPENCQSGQICPDSDCPYGKCSPGYWGRKCEHPLECLIPGDNGIHYRGSQNKTIDDTPCVYWDAITDFFQPPDGPHHNYCRHVIIDHTPDTWCYTHMSSFVPHADIIRWGHCVIPSCDTMCPPPNLQPNTTLKTIPSNGFVVGTNLTVECAVQDICEHNNSFQATKNCPKVSYSITGPRSIHCTDKKKWSTDFPICIATCNTSINPHSFIVNGRSIYKNQDIIEVRCESGYVTKDYRYFVCQNDMTWNGTLPMCSAICNKPVLAPNSHFINEHDVYAYNESLEIDCNPGYQTDDKRHFICQDDRHWNGSMPYCYAICSKPSVNDHSMIHNEASLYRYQDNITIVCDPGYETTDSTNLVCQDDRTWNRKPPVCFAISCDIPKLKNHSTALIKTQDIKYLDKITIVCDEGYTMDATGVLQCQANKLWDHDTPECEEKSTESHNSTKAIIGGVVATLAVIAIGILVIIFIRRRKCQQRNESSSANSRKGNNKIDRRPQAETFEMPSQGTYVNTVENDNGKDYDVIQAPTHTHTAVKVEDYFDYVSRRLTDKESLETEYKRLNLDFKKSMKNAGKAEHINKNRYKSICPYDENRVKLKTIPEKPGSDYINASFINGYGSVKKYIAAQAPLETTLDDFWRMIWEFNVKLIVMLNGDDEKRQKLYTKYWPDSGSRKFGYLMVSLAREDIFPDYKLRELSVTKSGESRTIKQYHVTVWPEKEIPENTSTLINVRNLVCSDSKSYEEPIVVHCSTGIGRSGTFIALDYLMDQAKTLQYVDVFECADKLGKQRKNMIQTKEQYIYLHEILQEALMCIPPVSVQSDDASFYQELLQREIRAPIYSTLQETARTYVNDDLV